MGLLLLNLSIDYKLNHMITNVEWIPNNAFLLKHKKELSLEISPEHHVDFVKNNPFKEKHRKYEEYNSMETFLHKTNSVIFKDIKRPKNSKTTKNFRIQSSKINSSSYNVEINSKIGSNDLNISKNRTINTDLI